MTKPISNFSNEFFKKLNKSGLSVPVRQSLLFGPIGIDGKADFLEIGTGLQVLTKNVNTIPLVFTLGDGFGVNGQRDENYILSENLSWGSLPASQANVYLYLEVLPNGSITAGNTLLEPVYSLVEPSVPAAGQYFYPTDHRSIGQVFNGFIWVPNRRIYVGQATTNATNVTVIRKIGYQEKGFVEQEGSLPYFAIRVKCVISGFNGAILKNNGVLSSSRVGVGLYDIVLSRPMPDLNYIVLGNTGSAAFNVNLSIMILNKTLNSFRLQVNNNNGSPADNPQLHFAVID